MAVGEDRQLAERLARIELLGAEAPLEIGEHLVEREPAERQRVGLPEQRALARVEQLAHHRRLRPRIDVGRRVLVVLDAGAQEPVEVLARDEQVLELVEDHQRRRLVALEQRLRQVEQPVDHRLRRLGSGAVGRGPTTTFAPPVPTLSPSRASSPARWARIQPLSSRRRRRRCGAPRRSCRSRARSRRARSATGLAQLRGVGEQQARLAVAARRRQPHAHAVARPAPSVVSSAWRSISSSGETGPSKRNGVPCGMSGQDIPDRAVWQYRTSVRMSSGSSPRTAGPDRPTRESRRSGC